MNLKKIIAKDIMSEVIVAVTEDTLVKDAAHLMMRDRISGMPVFDSQKNVVGILTLTDLFKAIHDTVKDEDVDFLKEILHRKDKKVSEIMTKNVLAISPDSCLHEIIAIMIEYNIHTFPVKDKDQLLGIIGRHDILNAVFSFS